MPKTKISEFSATPGNNTDIDGINIAEGCPPSGINDAIRELMAQLKDFQAGTAGDSFNGPVGTTTPAAGAFTNFSASGTFALTGDQVQISEGGTGQTTANAAFNALAPSQSTHAGKYLKTDGTNTSWDALDISTADITGTLPIANGGTGLTALGTGVQTALGQNVTGSGGIVLASSPSLTTPNLGTPSAVTLTNATGLPLSTGVTGTLATTNGGTGLTSFTANRVFYSSSTSAIGSSANLTFDGTTLTANALTTTSTVTINGGTANGVAYLNGSKVLTTGSALTFNGTNLYNTGNIYGGTSNANANIIAYSNVANGGAGFSQFLFANTNSETRGFLSYSHAAEAILFGTSGTEQMRLTSTGLGIGTSSPATKLDVNGDVTQRNGAGVIVGNIQNSSGWYDFKASNNTLGAQISTAAALPIRFLPNGTEQMRLDSSGNLGLGVTPSAWSSSGNIEIPAAGCVIGAGSSLYVGQNWYYGSSAFRYKTTAAAAYYLQSAGSHSWYTAASGTAGNAISFTQAMDLANSSGASTLTVNSAINTASAVRLTTNGGLTAGMFLAAPTADHSLGFQTAGSERARITSGGDLFVNRTSSVSGVAQFAVYASAKLTFESERETTSAASHIGFYNPNGQVGNITTNGSATSYNTSSDYRLKDNQQPLTGSGAFIDALKPKTWDWKSGGKGVGFIAHEVQEVSHGSVVGTKDAVDEEGKPIMQAMEYGSAEFIANIIAELQSLRARVAQLEAK